MLIAHPNQYTMLGPSGNGGAQGAVLQEKTVEVRDGLRLDHAVRADGEAFAGRMPAKGGAVLHVQPDGGWGFGVFCRDYADLLHVWDP